MKQPGLESKTQTLCRRLRDLAFQLGPETKFPTAVELCEQFSTSRTTLNDALDILEAQQVLLRRRGSGIYVSSKLHTKCICVLLYTSYFLGSNVSPFWGMLAALIAKEIEWRSASNAFQYEFHFVLHAEQERLTLSQTLQEIISSGRVHGVLTVGIDELTASWIHKQGVPCVIYAGYGPYMVTLDNSALLRQAVAVLAQQGCRRPGLWTEAAIRHTAQEPLAPRMVEQLFPRYLQEFGLPFHPSLVHYDTMTLVTPADPIPTFQQQGYRYVMDIFGDSSHERPDGLFIDNDMLTAGAIVAFQRLGIQLGKDVQVISHANAGSPILFGYEDQLHLVAFDPAELVLTMFQLLDSLMTSTRPATQLIQIQPHRM